MKSHDIKVTLGAILAIDLILVIKLKGAPYCSEKSKSRVGLRLVRRNSTITRLDIDSRSRYVDF